MKFSRTWDFFPNERRPRVFWAGIEAGAELGELAAAVETALEPLGIAREQRAFSPHLTLARFESPHDSIVCETPLPPPGRSNSAAPSRRNFIFIKAF